jgi:hypothetical protein
MTTLKRPRVRRTLERALLARDRVELAAAERLLALLKAGARSKTKRRPAR